MLIFPSAQACPGLGSLTAEIKSLRLVLARPTFVDAGTRSEQTRPHLIWAGTHARVLCGGAQLLTELPTQLLADLKAALELCTEPIFEEDLAYIYDAFSWVTPCKLSPHSRERLPTQSRLSRGLNGYDLSARTLASLGYVRCSTIFDIRNG